MAEPTKTEEAPPPRLTDDQIVLPDREIRLTNGTRVTVSPWGLSKGKIVLERLDGLTPKMLGGSGTWNAREVLSRAYEEMIDLVSLSVNVPVEEMTREPRDGGWTFEDLLETTEAVLEVCIIRSDGRGALPFLLRLVETMNQVVARSLGPATAARQLSNGSATPARSTNGRGRGSGSGPKKKKGKGRN